MNILIFLVNFIFLILPHVLLYDHNQPQKIQIPDLESYVQKILRSPVSIVSSNEKNISVLSWSNDNISWNVFQKIKLTNHNIAELNSYCHQKYTEEVQKTSKGGGVSTYAQNLLQGTGFMETTLMFLGSYTSNDFSYLGHRYYVPVAFLCTQMLTAFLCLFMMVQYSSFGLRESFLTRSDLQNYCNLVFCGWDYGIVNPDSATFQHERFFSSLMTCISENRIKKKLALWSTHMWTKLYAIRVFINCLVVLWIVGAYMIIYNVALYQMREKQREVTGKTGIQAFLVKVLPPVVILATQSISPVVMGILVKFEKYHAQTENNITLMRNAFLWLSSAFVLIMTFHSEIACEPRDACGKGISDCRCPRCWETFVGQQLYNLTIVDLFIYIGIFLFFDVLRDYLVTKFDNKCTRAIGRQTFFLPIQVLYPVYSQTILWLGVFYAPLLPAIMVLKLQFVFYIKKAMVLKYSEPSKTSYKASRFNSMFMIILMLSFFAVTAVHFYTLEKIKTSHGCSPFRSADLMINAIRDSLQNWSGVLLFWTFFHQEWCFIPIAMILFAAMYYYYGIIRSEQELSKRIRNQLILTSNDKQFLLQRIATLTKDFNKTIVKKDEKASESK
ncbi:transmembrane channel-like protein 7 [Uloborus diversus]|uniref:transmembrane channel-like protein 7 n=1 Tax=Uloborus diversus TaxID=327109 RepID=UPI002409C375|nr:transmembrane channel-like protein 7 [Uloborus diversus]